ncbi:MAG: peptide chain release factor N(5)-glutamine methyltransferase, partial [Ignavibacteria bacterium]|nr:peptide chain release factor N(5)-glutamine methyltransferase [Ignavibacteria bacterium]
MNEAVKTWRIIDILKVSEKLLEEKGIESPRLNAELLLGDTLNSGRMKLYLDFERPLTQAELDNYRNKIKRRLNSEPLQYITGKSGFYGLNFRVNPYVLIPRPETELLVEKSLDFIKEHRLENPKILEIGTGSGCISISIANNITCEIDAIDISEDALSVARENSESNGTSSKISFQRKDILKDIESFEAYDLVVSNPPYISNDEIAGLQEEVKNFEPFNALTDNSDGLDFYRKIIETGKKSSGGTDILLEIGDGKKELVESLLKEYNVTKYEFYRDLLNINRVVFI